MRARGKRAAVWSPLSPEARALIESEPDRWDYGELWDGAAAQSCAGGATRRPPELFTVPHGLSLPNRQPIHPSGTCSPDPPKDMDTVWASEDKWKYNLFRVRKTRNRAI